MIECNGAVDRFHKVVPAPTYLIQDGDHHHHQLFCSWRNYIDGRIVLHTYATMYSTSMFDQQILSYSIFIHL